MPCITPQSFQCRVRTVCRVGVFGRRLTLGSVRGVVAALILLAAPQLRGQSSDAWRSAYTGREATGPHVIGLWHFDDGHVEEDASGHQARAKLDGARPVSDGRFGGCLECFAGWPVEDKRHAALVPPNPSLSPRGAFTVELWLRPKAELADYRGTPYLIDKKYVAHTDYQLVLNAPSSDGSRSIRWVLGFGEDSETWISDAVRWEAGRWYHLAVTYDGRGTSRFFVDGRPVGGGTRAGRGGIAAETHGLSIGDRLGSNYAGFPGYLDEVRITEGIREFRPLVIEDRSRRHVFVRGENDAALAFRVTNMLDKKSVPARITIGVSATKANDVEPVLVSVPPLEPGASMDWEMPFPTNLRPDRYTLDMQVTTEGPEPYDGRESFPVTLVARSVPHRMPVVMWGIGGTDQVIEEIPRLKEIGFTHCLGLGVDYDTIWRTKQPVVDGDARRLASGARMLDEALANDLRIVVSLSPGHWLDRQTDLLRVDRQGKPYARVNVANVSPDIERFHENVGISIARTWGDFPALEAALINTEVRDGTNVSFHEAERRAFREYAGFDIPDDVVNARGVDYRRLSDVPADRILPDDDPRLVFYRWFWKQGDGWNAWHSATHRGFHSSGRKDWWTFFDPAVRVPSLWGSGGQVDFLSHWTYTYPDPLRIGLCADELSAMASGAGTRGGEGPQRIMKMTQIIWYRSQTAPVSSAAPSQPRSPWEDYDPDAAYITIAPMHLREALWTKLSRPVQGIMYHGWQSLVPGGQGAYRYTHPETRHELRRLLRDVVTPLGPTLMQIPSRLSDVGMLESFTSQMFAGRGTYGWGGSWAADMWLMLRYAHLQPDIIYEEHVLRDGLDRFRVLVLPDCDVLPKSVADKIRSFQQRGGIVVGDERLAPGIRPDITVPVLQRTKRADEDKKLLLNAAGELRSQLAARYRPAVETSTPEVVPYLRAVAEADYVFLVNDRREFGDYVGQHGLVMENGLPSQADVVLHRDAGYVYDLRASREVQVRGSGNGTLAWPVQLGPCDGAVFLVSEQAIEGVRVETAGEARAGETHPIRIRVVDPRGDSVRAVIPLRIDIRDPDGRPAEYSGFYGAATGEVEIDFEFAPNDRRGVWEIEARELASGRSATAYLRLE